MNPNKWETGDGDAVADNDYDGGTMIQMENEDCTSQHKITQAECRALNSAEIRLSSRINTQSHMCICLDNSVSLCVLCILDFMWPTYFV